MPKSKHRKNQKQKSRVRSERIKSEQAHAQKKMEQEFLKEMEKLRDRQLEIEEKKESDT
tara:strand:+ start:364 stop:540 length:177 start_codon:yes stop_codon:yes gene_type:complete